MSAETLRKAAEMLRERVWEANTSRDPENEEPWFKVPDEKSIRTKWVTFAEAYDHEAPYIAMMHPGVGLALADWLDATAPAEGSSGNLPGEWEAALAVARLILGGAS
jgi:hypothetical protein